jgi:hypothetical protein
MAPLDIGMGRDFGRSVVLFRRLFADFAAMQIGSVCIFAYGDKRCAVRAVDSLRAFAALTARCEVNTEKGIGGLKLTTDRIRAAAICT